MSTSGPAPQGWEEVIPPSSKLSFPCPVFSPHSPFTAAPHNPTRARVRKRPTPRFKFPIVRCRRSLPACFHAPPHTRASILTSLFSKVGVFCGSGGGRNDVDCTSVWAGNYVRQEFLAFHGSIVAIRGVYRAKQTGKAYKNGGMAIYASLMHSRLVPVEYSGPTLLVKRGPPPDASESYSDDP